MRWAAACLAQLAGGQPAAEADVKALEAKIGEKLEVTREAGDVAAAATSRRRWMKLPRPLPCRC